LSDFQMNEGASAQDRARQGGAVVAEQGSHVAGTAKEQVGRVAGEAADQARNLADELRQQVSGQAQAQTHRLSENLRRLSQDLHDMSHSAKPDSPAVSAVRRIAEGSGQLADHVEHRGPQGLLDDVQDFARRRPGVFLAGAALAGFAVARLSKSTAAVATSTGTPDTGTRDTGTWGTDTQQTVPIPRPYTEPATPLGTTGPIGQTEPPPYPVTGEGV